MWKWLHGQCEVVPSSGRDVFARNENERLAPEHTYMSVPSLVSHVEITYVRDLEAQRVARDRLTKDSHARFDSNQHVEGMFSGLFWVILLMNTHVIARSFCPQRWTCRRRKRCMMVRVRHL